MLGSSGKSRFGVVGVVEGASLASAVLLPCACACALLETISQQACSSSPVRHAGTVWSGCSPLTQVMPWQKDPLGNHMSVGGSQPLALR
jgi:hypothetical protein